MSKKDTQEVEPVESLESVIAAAYDSQTEEEVDDTEETDTAEPVEDSEGSEGAEGEEIAASEDGEGEEVREGTDSEDGEGDAQEGVELSEEQPDTNDDKLDPPDHWAATDKETFNEVPPKAQEFLLKRHKEMEGDYTRKMQEFAPHKRQFEAIADALEPTRGEWERAGLDYAGAVRQLASWDNALKTGGKAAVMQLAQTYGIDMAESEDDEYVDPQVQAVRKELADLKNQQARYTQAAQQEKQKQLLDVITTFEGETDETGALKHPHFQALKDDITRLFSAKMATDLPDAYNKALALRPDLNPAQQAVKEAPKKVDQFEKVRKAKKAATGVKSSGAVGKVNRGELSLRQELESHFN